MKRIVRIAAVVVLVVAAALLGGSFYLLSYALRPDAVMAEKEASSYKYMCEEYPFLEGWIDSLRTTGALRDTVITGAEGERLHAIYAAAPQPTDRTAVIVHGYTDNAVRMLMIGYLYNHDLGFNILLPDLHYHGESEGRAIRMGWRDRLDVLQWMEVANAIFGGNTRMVVHGISMGAATTMMVSGEAQQHYVKCFVEDCGYTSVWDQFVPAAACGQLALRPALWLEFPRGFGPPAGGVLRPSDALYPRRCRRFRSHAHGLSFVRGQAGRKGAVGRTGCRTCHVLPRQP